MFSEYIYIIEINLFNKFIKVPHGLIFIFIITFLASYIFKEIKNNRKRNIILYNINKQKERNKIIKDKKLKIKNFNIKKNKVEEYYQSKYKETEEILYNYALIKNDNNIVIRQLQKTAYDLLKFSENIYLKKDDIILPNKLKRRCYGCNKFTKKFHYDYIFSCIKCGNKFTKYRNISVNQDGKIAIVTGARCKIGHMTCIKLLKSGCIVIGLSRNPENMKLLFDEYKKDKENLKWLQNLDIYPKPLDFDCHNLQEKINELYNYIDNKYGKLDILINNSAQTIRSREKFMKKTKKYEEINRYGDLKYADINFKNSWEMNIFEVDQVEMEEIYRINVIAPFIITRTLIELMKKSKYNPFIINVHAREGIISVKKSKYHIHTNLGKSALHMFTKCLLSYNFKTHEGKKFRVHGINPGWVSVDEYYKHNLPYHVAPLTELDAASRILYVLFLDLRSNPKTRNHYDILTY